MKRGFHLLPPFVGICFLLILSSTSWAKDLITFEAIEWNRHSLLDEAFIEVKFRVAADMNTTKLVCQALFFDKRKSVVWSNGRAYGLPEQVKRQRLNEISFGFPKKLEKSWERVLVSLSIAGDPASRVSRLYPDGAVSEYVALAFADKPRNAALLFSRPSDAREGPRYYGYPLKTDGLRYHAGIDYLGSVDSPILAAGSGRVVGLYDVKERHDRGMGNTIIIQHAMPSPTFTLYAHLNRFDPQIGIGNYVARGQMIGSMGRTGDGAGDIVHLHFEVKSLNALDNTEHRSRSVGYCFSKSPDDVGYFDPNSFVGKVEFSDLSLYSGTPPFAKTRAELVSKPILFNPFTQKVRLDLRLELLNRSGTKVRDLATAYSQTFTTGIMGLTLRGSTDGLTAGDYSLRLLYKPEKTTKWFVLPSGTAPNPWKVTLTP